MAFFKKKESIVDTKNWYLDRYQSVVTQRNLLFLITIIALGGILLSVLVVGQISSSKSIDPFVIEVDSKTGITNVVRPFLKERILQDDAINEYFLAKYVNARESYHYYDFEYNYFTVTRVLSANDVYYRFRTLVRSDNVASPIRYKQKLSRDISINYITYIPSGEDTQGRVAQVKFVQVDKGVRNARKNRVATINFDYFDTKATAEERYINPLGFLVLGYNVVDENLVNTN